MVLFDGFLTLYEEGRDDAGDDEDGAPPARDERRATRSRSARSRRPAFHRAAAALFRSQLVKQMEELGIGRPSTYASILTVLRDRDYVRMDKKRLHPRGQGPAVTAFLESFFARYVEYDFTADLEEKLDLVSAGELDWKEVLRDFWRDFSAARRRDQGPAHRRRCSMR